MSEKLSFVVSPVDEEPSTDSKILNEEEIILILTVVQL